MILSQLVDDYGVSGSMVYVANAMEGITIEAANAGQKGCLFMIIENIKYPIGTTVEHNMSGEAGRVTGILIRPAGIIYYVSMFNGSYHEFTFYEFELKECGGI